MRDRIRICLPPGLGGPGRLERATPVAVVWSRGGRSTVETGADSRPCDDPIAAVQEILGTHPLPCRAVGFLGYGYSSRLDPLVAVPGGDGPLPGVWWAVLADDRSPARADGFELGGHVEVSLDDGAYRSAVSDVRSGIAAGDVYQVNVTRRWTAPFAGDPAGLFVRLGGDRGPGFATFLEDRDLGFAVVCLSPELLLARRGSRLETRPIKGTRARGADDREARAELRASPKDAAELAMIVDLERNDLGRVCAPGTVTTGPRTTLETADVLHLEQPVTGELATDLGWRDLLAALLPGGSVTGAPKLAACRVIARLEPVSRSVYCGALGVLEPGGDGTLALPIRTGYVTDRTLHFHAGCGIVWDSDPESEVAESRAKVRSWLAAAGVT